MTAAAPTLLRAPPAAAHAHSAVVHAAHVVDADAENAGHQLLLDPVPEQRVSLCAGKRKFAQVALTGGDVPQRQLLLLAARHFRQRRGRERGKRGKREGRRGEERVREACASNAGLGTMTKRKAC